MWMSASLRRERSASNAVRNRGGLSGKPLSFVGNKKVVVALNSKVVVRCNGGDLGRGDGDKQSLN